MAKGVGGGGGRGGRGGKSRVLGNTWDATQWEQEQGYDTWANQLDEHSRTALNDYTGGGYMPVNYFLRGKWEDITPAEIRDVTLQIKDMDRGLANAPPITESITVFRHVGGTIKESVPIGGTFTDSGFTSTSLYARGTATVGSGTPWTIRLPKGARGAAVTGLSKNPKEHEFLLPRGSKFRRVGETELELIL